MSVDPIRCDVLVPLAAARLYLAWTSGWGLWFAHPDSVRVSVAEGAPFFFAVVVPGSHPPVSHPHYGRFEELIPASLVRLTWVTRGTGGDETRLTVRLQEESRDLTRCTLLHEGFTSQQQRDQHAAAWPLVLKEQARRLSLLTDDEWRLHEERQSDGRGANRSMPPATLIPTRSYPDPEAAVHWLCDVLGATVRLRDSDKQVQLTVGNGAVVVASWDPAVVPATGGRPPATLLVRVPNVDEAYARAMAAGATALSAPVSLPFGERQAAVRDPAGHAWTLSQTIADVDPSTWGATLVT